MSSLLNGALLMPWNETLTMDQKTQFIADYLKELFSFTELCERYGISRKTGYKWVDRYLRDGPAGLDDRKRAPHQIPHKTPQKIIDALLEERRKHPTWGAGKLEAPGPFYGLYIAGAIRRI